MSVSKKGLIMFYNLFIFIKLSLGLLSIEKYIGYRSRTFVCLRRWVITSGWRQLWPSSLDSNADVAFALPRIRRQHGQDVPAGTRRQCCWTAGQSCGDNTTSREWRQRPCPGTRCEDSTDGHNHSGQGSWSRRKSHFQDEVRGRHKSAISDVALSKIGTELRCQIPCSHWTLNHNREDSWYHGGLTISKYLSELLGLICCQFDTNLCPTSFFRSATVSSIPSSEPGTPKYTRPDHLAFTLDDFALADTKSTSTR